MLWMDGRAVCAGVVCALYTLELYALYLLELYALYVLELYAPY